MTAPRLTIERAAILVDGVVYSLPRPYRHHDIIHMLDRAGFTTPIRAEHQGFLTSAGTFVGRGHATGIARRAGQFTAAETGLGNERLETYDLWPSGTPTTQAAELELVARQLACKWTLGNIAEPRVGMLQRIVDDLLPVLLEQRVLGAALTYSDGLREAARLARKHAAGWHSAEPGKALTELADVLDLESRQPFATKSETQG